MESVKILFQNIQSHENTVFSLEPGLNFILAEDNNVGKSTIFKLLSCIAKAPGVPSKKLDALIRYGCSEAAAAFRFGNEAVVARFTRYSGEAPKLFFEHQHPDGDTTRSVVCPRALLDALGIVVGENGDILNFNDADSVQLISEISTEADTIITHVMLDPKVERVKANMQSLGREINLDLRRIGGEVEVYEKTLKELKFQPAVDEFRDMSADLEALCYICDTLPNTDQFYSEQTVKSEDLDILQQLLTLVNSLSDYLDADLQEIRGYAEATAVVQVLQELAPLQGILKAASARTFSNEDIDSLRQVCAVASRLEKVLNSVKDLARETDNVCEAAVEKQALVQELTQRAATVECPIKGKVFYSNEECIPYSS